MQQSQEPDDAPREECATAAPSPLSPYVSAQKHEDEAEQSTQQEQQRPSKSRFDEYLDHPPSCTLWPQDRIECSMCGKRGRFYCPYCVAFVGKPDGVEVPEQLRLPLQVDVIVTAQERRRSSGVHVAVVTPQSVRVIQFNEAVDALPTYDPGFDLVVFPSKESVCWEDLSQEEVAAARRIILVDSRWETTGTVLNHSKLRGLRHVRIKEPPARSRFWRWHISGDGHICTAEATYFVLRDYEVVSGVCTEGGRLEDIMFLFALMHSRIKEAYANEPTKAGQEDPSTEAAKRRRRARSVRLENLVKAKYKGLVEVKEKEGDEAAVEEFCRRRRGTSVYIESARRVRDGKTSSGVSRGREHRSGSATDDVLDRRR